MIDERLDFDLIGDLLLNSVFSYFGFFHHLHGVESSISGVDSHMNVAKLPLPDDPPDLQVLGGMLEYLRMVLHLGFSHSLGAILDLFPNAMT